MTEQEIRNIVRDEIQKNAQQSQYNVSKTTAHIHNGIDSPNLPPTSIQGFVSITGAGTTANPGVIIAAVDQYVVGPPSHAIFFNPASTTAPVMPTITVYPIPIIYGHGVGTASAFNGGEATPGTMLFFDNGLTLSALWVKTENGWYGISPDSVM